MSGSPNNSNYEEVWEVDVGMMGPPTPGNKGSRTKAASQAALRLFNEPKTPPRQVRTAANWRAPKAGQVLKVHPNVYRTPQRPIRFKEPVTPKKNNGSRRRNRRRNTRRLRK